MSRVPPLLAALALAACLPPAPPPEPVDLKAPAPDLILSLAPRPIVAGPSPVVRGPAVYGEGQFRSSPNYASCTAPDPGSCLTWTAPVPSPPPGFFVQALPLLPIYDFSGAPVVVLDDAGNRCEEQLRGGLSLFTDADPRPIPLTRDPVLLPPLASTVSVTACWTGIVSARLGRLSGSFVFAP